MSNITNSTACPVCVNTCFEFKSENQTQDENTKVLECTNCFHKKTVTVRKSKTLYMALTFDNRIIEGFSSFQRMTVKQAKKLNAISDFWLVKEINTDKDYYVHVVTDFTSEGHKEKVIMTEYK